VGAAVRDRQGRIFTGSNVENSSYGLTVCAERVAVFKAISEGAKKLVAVAVSVDPRTSRDPFFPCGACRQVLSEFMGPDGVVLVDREGGFRLGDLLPVGLELGAGKRGEGVRGRGRGKGEGGKGKRRGQR
jgi:cytidine deaminase